MGRAREVGVPPRKVAYAANRRCGASLERAAEPGVSGPRLRMHSKHLLLFPLAAASLLAQAPLSSPKIPQAPSVGVEKSFEPLPVKDGVPTATDLVVPAVDVRPAVASAAEAAAIDGARSALQQRLADPEFLAFDVEADGTRWAVGNGFKAAFAGDHWRFFGKPDATATELSPIDFRLQRASVGGEPLPLAAARRIGDERTIRYDRGSVVEGLAIAPRGVEQTFTFASLPTRGELLVEIAVQTALQANLGDEGLVFTGPHDRVVYSPAIAIDGKGARIAAPIAYANGSLSIRVPADFVAQATLPLVIDPWVTGTVAYTSTTNDVGEPDVAWDETGQVWAVAFMRLFGAGDWDCYVQRVSATSPMTLVGTLSTIDASSISWFRPRIANLDVYSTYMVVAQTRSGTNPWNVQGRLLANSGIVLGNQFVVHSSTVDDIRPDVGGNSGPPPCYFTVVWEHAFSATDHDIYARQVEATGALRGTSPIYVQTNTANQSWPAISNSCGGGNAGTQRFAIVYQQAFSAFDNDVYGALLTWDGVQMLSAAGGSTFPLETGGFNATLPTVSSPTLEDNNQRQFLAAWERSNYEAGNIAGACFDLGGTVLASADLTDLEPNLVRRAWPQARPSVDSDGYRFVVAYQEVFNGQTTTNDLDTRATIVARSGNTLFAEEYGVALGFSGNREFNVALASRYSGHGYYSPMFAAANDYDGISGSPLSIDADAYTATPSGLFVQRTTACGSTGISWSGNAIPGGAVTVSVGASPNLRGMIVGTPVSVVLGFCPSCTLGVDGFLWNGDSFTLFVPLSPAVVGFTFSAQGFELAPSGAPCLGQISLTDTVDVTIG